MSRLAMCQVFCRLRRQLYRPGVCVEEITVRGPLGTEFHCVLRGWVRGHRRYGHAWGLPWLARVLKRFRWLARL